MSESKPKSRAWKVPVRIAQAVGFSVIEALAAIQLGGVLGVLLWGLVAWNMLVVVIIIWGIAMLADEHLRTKAGETAP